MLEESPVQSSAVIITERCHYCSKSVAPGRIRRIGDSMNMCDNCHANHIKRMMEFEPPPYCQACMRTTAALAALGQTKMAVHYKDGIYQVLCVDCDARYVQLRKDLFGATQFGYHERKL